MVQMRGAQHGLVRKAMYNVFTQNQNYKMCCALPILPSSEMQTNTSSKATPKRLTYSTLAPQTILSTYPPPAMTFLVTFALHSAVFSVDCRCFANNFQFSSMVIASAPQAGRWGAVAPDGNIEAHEASLVKKSCGIGDKFRAHPPGPRQAG